MSNPVDYEKEMQRYSQKEVAAYDDVLAIGNGLHHRIKMISVARRSKNAQKGRSLGKDLYLNIDELGNPVFQHVTYGGSISPICRFTVGGFFVGTRNVPRESSPVVDAFIKNYSDYKLDVYKNALTPKNVALLATEAGHVFHNVSSYGIGCECDDCISMYQPWEDKVSEKNKAYSEFTASLNLMGDSEHRVFVPYSENATSEAMSFLPAMIDIEWDKVKKARGWNRKDKKETGV